MPEQKQPEKPIGFSIKVDSKDKSIDVAITGTDKELLSMLCEAMDGDKTDKVANLLIEALFIYTKHLVSNGKQ